MGRGGLNKRQITFIVAKKLNLPFILLYLRYMRGRGLVENVIWGEGLGENVRKSSCRGRGLKLLKNRHMIFERFLTGVHALKFYHNAFKI